MSCQLTLTEPPENPLPTVLYLRTSGIARRKQEKEERKEAARLEAEANAANDPKGKNAKAAAAAAAVAAQQAGQEEEGEEEEIGPCPSAGAQVGIKERVHIIPDVVDGRDFIRIYSFLCCFVSTRLLDRFTLV